MNKKNSTPREAGNKNVPAAAGRTNFTYVLRCGDGSLYTGWTNDLKKRVQAHNAGTGSKYTRSHRPVELVYYECFETKEEAMQREYAIKHLSREEKEALIRKEKGH